MADKDIYQCLNIANLAQNQQVPALYVQSPYDSFNHFWNLVGSSADIEDICVSAIGLVQSLEECSKIERTAIEDMRI